MKPGWLGGLLVLLACGCATPRPQPLTAGDVISLTQAGRTDTEIIQCIADSRTVFHLNAAAVARLRHAGVSARVVEYLGDTAVRSLAEEQRQADIADEEWHQRYGLWSGRP